MPAANFTSDDIKAIENSNSLQEAKERLLSILDGCSLGNSRNPIKPRKVAFLRQRVESRTTVDQVAAIGYNMLLVGEGMSVDSSYQRLLGGRGWRR